MSVSLLSVAGHTFFFDSRLLVPVENCQKEHDKKGICTKGLSIGSHTFPFFTFLLIVPDKTILVSSDIFSLVAL